MLDENQVSLWMVSHQFTSQHCSKAQDAVCFALYLQVFQMRDRTSLSPFSLRLHPDMILEQDLEQLTPTQTS